MKNNQTFINMEQKWNKFISFFIDDSIGWKD